MERLEKIKNLLIKYKDLFYLVVVLVLLIFMLRGSSKNTELENELKRQYNNELAIRDTLTQYQDKLGRINAEKHAYQLTQDELLDSIDLLKKKHYEYVSYISSKLGVSDTIFAEVIIERLIKDTNYIDNGTIKIDTSDVFGKSSRHLALSIPFVVDTQLHINRSTINIEQNIFVEGWLDRNLKSGETFVHLRSDYPGINFNSGMGVVVESSNKYERSLRKRNGIGFFVGPSIGVGKSSDGWRPYFGISTGIGYTRTPRWAQW